MTATNLPIFELESDLVAALQGNNRLVLQAPTGSGKSTQVPQMLLDHGVAGAGQIVVLQPRRLATRMLAARVAAERGVRLGEEVGYQIRFENVTTKSTRIRYVTEGVLLRQFIDNPTLAGITVLVFDEFHERHLEGDITLARALELQERKRADLIVIVMSATIVAEQIADYLAPCSTLHSGGRTFPVEIQYLPRPIKSEAMPVWDLAVVELERLASLTTGDVLVFMPGTFEINRTIQAIKATRLLRDFIVLPLHGDLPPAQQDAAVAEYRPRKVIVSTNIAETSLTISGVRLVIDSGLARIARYDPNRGLNTLRVEEISRASAEQRAGRAGRIAPGQCLRLWTAREHETRRAQELPEVKRLDLAEVVLALKGSEFNDLAAFRWLEPPETPALERAEMLLHDLGATDRTSGEITAEGKRMLAFPLHPRYARMLLAASEYRCVPTAALMAALTQGRGLLRRGETGQMAKDRDDLFRRGATSDLLVLTRAWDFAERCEWDAPSCERAGINVAAARETAQWLDHFLRIARAKGLALDDEPMRDESIARCLLAGFPDHVAVRLDAGTLRCALVHGRRALLARESVVTRKLLVSTEVREVQIKGELSVLLTLASPIEEEWLRDLFPQAFEEQRRVFYDADSRRVLARIETHFHDLVLRSTADARVAPEEAAAILAREVVDGRCALKEWDHAIEQWIARVNCVHQWFPELEVPPIRPADQLMLLEQICYGATTFREIKDRPVWPTVRAWLSPHQQQQIDELAPERVALPNGRKCKITYGGVAAPPTIAVRIQDLYGVEGSIRIARGRVTLLIEVLAPNHRGVQITDNLQTFWRDSYPRLKQELQRKYPKHEWR